MEIHFYKTGCADAARISFMGRDNEKYNLFIDAGFERTFRNILYDEITKISFRGEKINLWVISHIHDDHIGGAISHVNAIKSKLIPDIVEKWYYNPPRLPLSVMTTISDQSSMATSIRQGEHLTNYLYSSGKPNNQPVHSGLDPLNIGGLIIQTLSPNKETLVKLIQKYQVKNLPLEMSENDQISLAKRSIIRDYHFKVDQIDCSSFTEDNNIENGSSIALLTDYYGFKILWLADAHPSIVIESLNKLGYTEDNPLICDWVKVSHHGSMGNSSSSLYSLIRCPNYIFSVNGDNIHGLPSKRALVTILKNPFRDYSLKYHFHFTHSDSFLKSIFDVDSDSIFEELNFQVHYLENGNSIKVNFNKVESTHQ